MAKTQKKFSLQTTIRWTPLEVGMLRYLARVTERTNADNVRQALRQHTKQIAQFNPNDFAAHMQEMLNQMPHGTMREALRDAMMGFMAAEDQSPMFNSLVMTTASHRAFAAKASDFDRDV